MRELTNQQIHPPHINLESGSPKVSQTFVEVYCIDCRTSVCFACHPPVNNRKLTPNYDYYCEIFGPIPNHFWRIKGIIGDRCRVCKDKIKSSTTTQNLQANESFPDSDDSDFSYD